MNLAATWSGQTHLSDLVLSTNTSGTLTTRAINAAGKLVEATAPDGKYLYASALVSIGVGESTEAQRKANAGTWTATIEVDGNAAANAANRVILGSSASGDNTFADADSNVVTFNFTIDKDGALSNNTKTVYIRVDGGSGTIGDTVSAVTWASTYTSGNPSVKVNSTVNPAA